MNYPIMKSAEVTKEDKGKYRPSFRHDLHAHLLTGCLCTRAKCLRTDRNARRDVITWLSTGEIFSAHYAGWNVFCPGESRQIG